MASYLHLDRTFLANDYWRRLDQQLPYLQLVLPATSACATRSSALQPAICPFSDLSVPATLAIRSSACARDLGNTIRHFILRHRQLDRTSKPAILHQFKRTNPYSNLLQQITYTSHIDSILSSGGVLKYCVFALQSRLNLLFPICHSLCC